MLKKGQVITIEPFLSNGAHEVIEQDDGWTLSTPSPFLAAQYEHTIVITEGTPLIMTLPG
jgi:methionyl aminopeptidase